MKTTVDRRELAETLKWVCAALDKSPDRPAMAGVRVTVTETEVTLSAWDLIAAHSATIQAPGSTPGEALIPGTTLRQVVSGMRGREVSLSVAEDDLRCEVRSGASSYRLSLLDLNDFTAPPMPPEPDGQTAGAEFAEAVATVASMACGDAPGEPTNLSQVRLEAIGGLLSLAATNRFQLAVDAVEWDGPDFGVGLPSARFAAAIGGLAGAESIGIGGVLGDEGLVCLAAGGRSVSLRRHGEKFLPDGWRNKLFEPVGDELLVSAADLAGAAKSLNALVGGDAAVAFVVSDDGVTGPMIRLSARTQVGDGEEVVTASGDLSAEVSTGFNPKYLAEVLSAFDGNATLTVSGGVGRSGKALYVTGASHPRRTTLLQPRRLS